MFASVRNVMKMEGIVIKRILKRNTAKKLIIVIIGGLMAGFLIAYGVHLWNAKPNEPNFPPLVNEEKTVEIPEPREPQLPGALLVMIDNLKPARPQSDLDKADLVYEIIAEAGITRYLALFYHQEAEKIGPVRSTRGYFVQLARGYDAPLAHAGGSQEALAMIPQIGVKDFDEIYNSSAYFWRDKTRKKPHNLYTSTEKLLQGAKKKGYKLETPFLQPWGTEWVGTPFSGELVIDYSVKNYPYKVSWRYHENRYERAINGQPHVMEDDILITADNLLVMVTKITTYVKDGIPLSDVKVVGKGDLVCYIDGQKLKGYWQKDAVSADMKFYDQQGELLKLKRGTTWIQVVPSLECVTEIPEDNETV
jgi:hypothetical protein